MDININGPGDPSTIFPATLETSFGPGGLFECGEVLRGVLENKKPLSVRDDVSVESWRVVEPVLDAWHAGRVPLDDYRTGSSGPTAGKDWPI